MSAPGISSYDILCNFARGRPEELAKAERFLSSSAAGHRYLLGRNQHALALSKVIEIDGFVDDFAETGAVWLGKPVVKMADLDNEACVVNCSMSISPVSAMTRLRGTRSALVLNYSDLLMARPEQIEAPDFVGASREDYKENEAQLNGLYEALADDESKWVMRALANYRLTGDPVHMEDFSVRISDQYFEDFLALKDPVFLDAGGFDGDTTQEFCKRYPEYKKVFLFEPSLKNINAAKKRLSNLSGIQYIQLGLSDSVGSLWFNPDAGSASALSECGSEKINITTIDQHISECVSFIKMDIEGWELAALKGARKHIENNHPALAIAVYHHPSDFWRIYDYIAEIKPAYSVYLRHYTEGWSETVMYFIPK